MKTKFQDLFNYNHDCNQKLINFISLNYEKVSAKAIELLNHYINAHQIWNSRISKTTEFGLSQINDINLLDEIDKRNYSNTLMILNEHHLNGTIAYSNSKGQQFSNKIEDILFHIINHSTYHRAQIATEIKNCGLQPINTDFIFYKR